MICLPIFIKIGSGIQKLIGDTQAQRKHSDKEAYSYFLKIWKLD
jgi:hypothetical protein